MCSSDLPPQLASKRQFLSFMTERILLKQKEQYKLNMNELKEALISLPQVQIVWVDENSNWYFRKPTKIEVVEMTGTRFLIMAHKSLRKKMLKKLLQSRKTLKRSKKWEMLYSLNRMEV